MQKSQLVNLTPKEILDRADSSFGQMHTLVACLEAWEIIESRGVSLKGLFHLGYRP